MPDAREVGLEFCLMPAHQSEFEWRVWFYQNESPANAGPSLLSGFWLQASGF
jgi:hypothetical protein